MEEVLMKVSKQSFNFKKKNINEKVSCNIFK